VKKKGVLLAMQVLIEQGVSRQPVNAKENYRRHRENGEAYEHYTLTDEYQSSAREHFSSLSAKNGGGRPQQHERPPI
jgi:hypothetical protein